MLYIIILIATFIFVFLPTYLVLSKENYNDFYFYDVEGKKILLEAFQKSYVKITDTCIYKNYDNTFNIIKKYFRIVFFSLLLFTVYTILFYFELKNYVLENYDFIIFISKIILVPLTIIILFLINNIKVNFYYDDTENNKILYRKILFGNFKKVNGNITYKYFNKNYKMIIKINFRDGIPRYIELKMSKNLITKFTIYEIINNNFNAEFTTFIDKRIIFLKGKGLIELPECLYGNYFNEGKMFLQIKKNIFNISCKLKEDTYFFGDIYSYNHFLGPVGIENFFKDSILKGILEKFYENGKLQEIMVIENRNGYVENKGFYENGNLKFDTYSKMKEFGLNGIAKFYYENGNLKERRNYNCGHILGLSESFYENGKLQEIKDLDSDGNGSFDSFYEDGKLKEKGNYENYVKNGLFEKFSQSGKLEERGNYENGSISGNFERFYNNGNLKERGKVYQQYLDNKPKLIKIENFEYFYENGKLRERGNYNYSGKKDGLFEYFSKNGKLIKKENYKDGELI